MALRPAIIRALFAPAFLVSACVTAPLQPSDGTTSISQGRWYASYCVSTCFGPYKVTVSSDGVVTDEFAGHEQRGRISAAKAAKFRKILAPYRPGAKWPPPVTCEQHTGGKYTAPYSYSGRLAELELTWSDRNGTDRLIACDTPENATLSNAISQALKLIHFSGMIG
jgi:hypothetical protein